MKNSGGKIYLKGVKDGVPIGLGYLAVGFALGIFAKQSGLTAFQGFLASLLNNASAGEYAGFTQIAASASFFEIALITMVTNLRYLLMSTALSQRLDPKLGTVQRMLIAFDVTDEVFGAMISSKEKYVSPVYYYGLITCALPGWSVGTLLGVVVGNILPEIAVIYLSVALYGMFIAVIIPPARQNKAVLVTVAASFALSFSSGYLPLVKDWSEGARVIVLTLVISAAAAISAPRKDEETEDAA